MTDRELVTKIKAADASEKKVLEGVLFTRYEKFLYKNWAVLRRQMNNSPEIINMEGDFKSEAYLALKKALKAVNLDKIRDDNWKFMGYYGFYLKNARNKMISNHLSKYANETSLFIPGEGGADVAITDFNQGVVVSECTKYDPPSVLEFMEGENNCNRAINSCMKKWDEKRRSIFRMRQAGVSKSNIARELGVHPATITYYLTGMKKDMEKELGK